MLVLNGILEATRTHFEIENDRSEMFCSTFCKQNFKAAYFEMSCIPIIYFPLAISIRIHQESLTNMIFEISEISKWKEYSKI